MGGFAHSTRLPLSSARIRVRDVYLGVEVGAMPKAGWCSECDANVWLTDEGACVNGHGADSISNVYETEPGKDSLAEAGEAIENAAREVGAAAKGAWKDAEPAAKEAAEAATEAAKKAAEAAKQFGSKLFASDDEPAAPSSADEVSDDVSGEVEADSADDVK